MVYKRRVYGRLYVPYSAHVGFLNTSPPDGTAAPECFYDARILSTLIYIYTRIAGAYGTYTYVDCRSTARLAGLLKRLSSEN